MSALFSYLINAVGVLLVYFFIRLVARWPQLGALSMAVSCLIAWEIPSPDALVRVYGLSIYYLDVLSVAFLVIVLTRLRQLVANLSPVAWAWLGILGLLGVSLVRGLAGGTPVGPATVEFRSYFTPLIAVTWAMSLNWTPALSRSLVFTFSAWLGWGLTLVAGYHLAVYGLGSTSDFVDAGTGILQTSRPLIANQALMLFLCACLSLFTWARTRSGFMLVSGITFLVIVLVTQQRTVWAVAIAAGVVVLLASRQRTRLTLIGASVVAAMVFSVLLLSDALPGVVAVFSDAASDTGTLNGRVLGWSSLIDDSLAKGPLTVLFGAGFGDGFGRLEGTQWITYAPHNWYVSLYLRAGLVGLALMLLVLLGALRTLVKRRSNMAVLATVVALTVYGWTYSWPWPAGIFLGWALTTAFRPPEGDPEHGAMKATVSRGASWPN